MKKTPKKTACKPREPSMWGEDAAKPYSSKEIAALEKWFVGRPRRQVGTGNTVLRLLATLRLQAAAVDIKERIARLDTAVSAVKIMPTSKIPWTGIWGEFDEWLLAQEADEPCAHCGQWDKSMPEWPDQQAAIERFVEAVLVKR